MVIRVLQSSDNGESEKSYQGKKGFSHLCKPGVVVMASPGSAGIGAKDPCSFSPVFLPPSPAHSHTLPLEAKSLARKPSTRQPVAHLSLLRATRMLLRCWEQCTIFPSIPSKPVAPSNQIPRFSAESLLHVRGLMTPAAGSRGPFSWM